MIINARYKKRNSSCRNESPRIIGSSNSDCSIGMKARKQESSNKFLTYEEVQAL